VALGQGQNVIGVGVPERSPQQALIDQQKVPDRPDAQL